jgi:thioredoxin 1
MPVFVDPSRCPCATPCFPAKMCPYQVLQFDMANPTKPATLNAEQCGDCRGICTNFCDPRALRFAPTMEELRLVEAEILQTMSSEEISAERKRLHEEQEASKKKAAAVTEVTSATFEQEVLQASQPVFVDLWAPWCGPCKAFGPIFEQVAQEFVGKAKFCKINTEAEQELARALRVQSIPTLFVFYGGQALGGRPGAMSAAQLRAIVEQVLQSVQAAPTPPAPPPR